MNWNTVPFLKPPVGRDREAATGAKQGTGVGVGVAVGDGRRRRTGAGSASAWASVPALGVGVGVGVGVGMAERDGRRLGDDLGGRGRRQRHVAAAR